MLCVLCVLCVLCPWGRQHYFLARPARAACALYAVRLLPPVPLLRGRCAGRCAVSGAGRSSAAIGLAMKRYSALRRCPTGDAIFAETRLVEILSHPGAPQQWDQLVHAKRFPGLAISVDAMKSVRTRSL